MKFGSIFCLSLATFKNKTLLSFIFLGRISFNCSFSIFWEHFSGAILHMTREWEIPKISNDSPILKILFFQIQKLQGPGFFLTWSRDKEQIFEWKTCLGESPSPIIYITILYKISPIIWGRIILSYKTFRLINLICTNILTQFRAISHKSSIILSQSQQ